MSDFGALFIYGAASLLLGIAFLRRDGSLQLGMHRALSQAVQLLPRMVVALIAAGFAVTLIPTDIIVRYLGSESGLVGIVIGSMTGLIVPGGPVIAFAIAAAFAGEGASLPSLVAFVSGWSVFATHRVVIFEIPMLGVPFVKLRMLAVLPVPILAGLLTMLVTGIS